MALLEITEFPKLIKSRKYIVVLDGYRPTSSSRLIRLIPPDPAL